MRKLSNPSLRVCVVCGNNFYGLTSGKTCSKECRREGHRAYTKNHFKHKPNQYLFYGIKARCKARNIPFNLTLDDIVIPDRCPVLGIPLFRNTGANKPSGNSPSVDRIKPELGYVKGNIQVISQRANIMKNDASVDELISFADWVNKNYKND